MIKSLKFKVVFIHYRALIELPVAGYLFPVFWWLIAIWVLLLLPVEFNLKFKVL